MVDLRLNVPSDFYEEETRCNYVVSKEIKQVWAVELDLLYELDRVCKKHNLIYYADGGTLLGAIRHRGFIPWDDDVDIVMMRDQYDKLCTIAESEFKSPYFLQTGYSDPGSFRGHAQLRNGETTAILINRKEKKINQGIFIDIFPLDNVIDDKEALNDQIKNCQEALFCGRRAAVYSGYEYMPGFTPLRDFFKRRLIRLLSAMNYKKDFNHFYFEFEEECKKYNTQDTEMVAKFFMDPRKQHQIWNKSDFNSYEYLPFEFIKIPVPVGYERILNTFFGENWRTPIISDSLHGKVFFDTDKPYSYYVKD